MRLEIPIMFMLIAALTVLPSTASATALREAPTIVFPNSEFNITLTLSDVQVGGVVETLPSGFTFVSTDCPWYNVSGQRVAFALVNTTSITYTVRAPSGGGGTLTGVWEDLLNASNGSIGPTTIAVKTSSALSKGMEAVPSVSVPLPSIGAGEEKSISLPPEVHDEHVSFTSIEIAAKDEIPSEVMKMEVYDTMPTGVSAPAYPKVLAYLHVSTGVKEESIASVSIRFTVNASTVEHPERVVLLRWQEDTWQPLNTSYVGEVDGKYVFVATSQGLSLYAVAEKSATAPAQTATPTPTAMTSPTPSEQSTSSKTPGFGVLLAVLSIMAAMGCWRCRR